MEWQNCRGMIGEYRGQTHHRHRPGLRELRDQYVVLKNGEEIFLKVRARI